MSLPEHDVAEAGRGWAVWPCDRVDSDAAARGHHADPGPEPPGRIERSGGRRLLDRCGGLRPALEAEPPGVALILLGSELADQLLDLRAVGCVGSQGQVL